MVPGHRRSKLALALRGFSQCLAASVPRACYRFLAVPAGPTTSKTLRAYVYVHRWVALRLRPSPLPASTQRYCSTILLPTALQQVGNALVGPQGHHSRRMPRASVAAYFKINSDLPARVRRRARGFAFRRRTPPGDLGTAGRRRRDANRKAIHRAKHRSSGPWLAVLRVRRRTGGTWGSVVIQLAHLHLAPRRRRCHHESVRITRLVGGGGEEGATLEESLIFRL